MYYSLYYHFVIGLLFEEHKRVHEGGVSKQENDSRNYKLLSILKNQAQFVWNVYWISISTSSI